MTVVFWTDACPSKSQIVPWLYHRADRRHRPGVWLIFIDCDCSAGGECTQFGSGRRWNHHNRRRMISGLSTGRPTVSRWTVPESVCCQQWRIQTGGRGDASATGIGLYTVNQKKNRTDAVNWMEGGKIIRDKIENLQRHICHRARHQVACSK